MKYAIKYHYTPEELADKIVNVCENAIRQNGYNMREYYGRERLEDVAAIVESLHTGIDQNEQLQLADSEQFETVYKILECNNYHTENMGFCLAFGDASQVFDVLKSIHYFGQCHAIYNDFKHAQAI
jgi:hypothetical protein